MAPYPTQVYHVLYNGFKIKRALDYWIKWKEQENASYLMEDL